MREKNFRTRFCTGRFTFPALLAVVAVLLLFGHWQDLARWGGLAAVGATAVLLAELNDRYALLRERSDLPSVVFLLLAAATPSLWSWTLATVPMLAMLVAYFLLLNTYQQREVSAQTFHVGFLFGLSALVYPPIVCLLPAALLALTANLRALTLRSFFSLLIGALFPAWLAAAWAVWKGSLPELLARVSDAFRFAEPDYASLTVAEIVVAGACIVLSLFAAVHFFRTSYSDKIRIRQFFNVFILFEVFLAAALALQPQQIDVLLPLLLLNSSHIIARHLISAKGRLANIWFYACLLVLAGAIVYNFFIWNQSQTLS